MCTFYTLLLALMIDFVNSAACFYTLILPYPDHTLPLSLSLSVLDSPPDHLVRQSNAEQPQRTLVPLRLCLPRQTGDTARLHGAVLRTHHPRRVLQRHAGPGGCGRVGVVEWAELVEMCECVCVCVCVSVGADGVSMCVCSEGHHQPIPSEATQS